MHLLLLVVVGAFPMAAQGAPSPAIANKVAPFVDELTWAAVYVDPTRADIDRLMDLAVPIVRHAARGEDAVDLRDARLESGPPGAHLLRPPPTVSKTSRKSSPVTAADRREGLTDASITND